MNILAFVRARLDEDQAVARAADPGPWEVITRPSEDGFRIRRVDDPSAEDVVGPGYEDGGVWQDDNATHIARHDPARVLRDVAAKQRILAVHRPYVVEPDQACLGCAGDNVWERCPVLRALAAVYDDHPDYREEWRPVG